MANLADGYYIVHSAYRHSSYELVLDKEANQTVNGTNIRVWNRNNTDAQIIRVLTMSDGTRRMLFRDCGKAVDVLAGDVNTDGTNIQVFDSNNTRAQQVTITATGGSSSTITWNGTTYDKYYIKWSSGKVACVSGTPTEGSNVVLGAETNNRAYQWFFEPIPSLRTGGSYRILSMLDPSYCLQIAAQSAANGANVNLGKYNGLAGQLFVIEEDNGKWAIRNPQSGRYMDVAGGAAQNGTNVQIWDDNDSRAQRWNFHAYGNTTYQGKEYPTYTIGSYVTESGLNYNIDVKGAETVTHTNVQIWDANNTYAQLFILVPTEMEDPTLPMPYDAKLASTPGGDGATWQLSASKVYPTWYCSDAWAADGNNHYEWRSRMRCMYSDTSAWTAWTDDGNRQQWNPWQTAYVKKSGRKVWLAEGIDADIASTVSTLVPSKFYWWKRAQIEFQVRSSGVNEYKLLHSKPLDVVFDIYMKPTISLTGATWSADGLRLDWTTDYLYGQNYVTVLDVVNSNGRSILDDKYELASALASGYGTIPAKCFNMIPTNQESITIKYRVGYDQFKMMPGNQTQTLTCARNAGSTSGVPTFSMDGLNAYADVPDLGARTECWISLDNELIECHEAATSPSGKKRFILPYPMGRGFGVFTLGNNASGSRWGTAYIEHDAVDVIAHAWSWDGGACYLHKFTEMPTTTMAYQAVYEADVLDSRKHESVSFANTVRGTFSATGALLHEDDYSSIDEFKELIGKHAIYRDINGGIRHVGITGVNVTRYEIYDVVTVQMTEETV